MLYIPKHVCNWLSVYIDAVVGDIEGWGERKVSMNKPSNRMRSRLNQSKSRKKQILSTWEQVHYLVQIIPKELIFLNS